MNASKVVVYSVAEIHQEHKAAQASARDAVAHAIRCGELLLQVKAQLQHGTFLPWLVANVDFDERTAQRYMVVASLPMEKRHTVSDLSLRKALTTTMTSAKKKKQKQKTPNVTKPSDFTAKRIIKELERLAPADLSDPAWFAGQLHFHASRLNPLRMPIAKQKAI